MGFGKFIEGIKKRTIDKPLTEKQEEVKKKMAAEIMKDFNVTQEDAEILARARMIRDEAKKYADFMDRKGFEAWFGFLPFFNLGDILPAVASSAYLMYLGKKMGFKLEDYGTIAGTQVIDVGIGLLPIVGNIIGDFLWKSNKQSVTLFDRCIRNMEKEMIKRGNTEKEIKIVEAERGKISDAIQSYINLKALDEEKKELNDAQGTLANIAVIIEEIRKRGNTKEDIDALEERVSNALTEIERIINDMTSKNSIDEINKVKEIKTILEKIRGVIVKIKKGRIEEEDEKTLLETVEGAIGNFFKKGRKKITTEKTDEEKKQKEEERENKKKERRQKKAQRKQRKEVEQQESKIKKLIKGKSIEPNESNYENYTITKDNLDRVCKLLFGDGKEYNERYEGVSDDFKTNLSAIYDYESIELKNEVIQEIFKYCRDFRSKNQAARDILLLATKKESAEPEVEESEEVKKLKEQASHYEEAITKNIEGKELKIGTEGNPKEEYYLYLNDFKPVYQLLFGEEKNYSNLYDEVATDFKEELNKICNPEGNISDDSVWIYNNWTKENIMKIFDLCLIYKDKNDAAKHILLLAQNLGEWARTDEKKISDYIDGKTKNDIKVNKGNYTNFTVETEVIAPIYRLLYSIESDYSEKYNGINQNLKDGLYNSIFKIKSGNYTEDDIKKIFELCLEYPDDPAATDILLMAKEKDGSSELETEEKKSNNIEFEIIEPKEESTIDVIAHPETLVTGSDNFNFPDLSILTSNDSKGQEINREKLEKDKNKIVETLSNYGININKIVATVGPAITLYEIFPSSDTLISKVKNLEDDICLSLAALGVRMIIRMPEKGTFGIEIPNDKIGDIPIKSVLSSERFSKSTYKLPCAIGKDINNDTYVFDLSNAGNVLIAGAVAQGKSTCLHTIISSLLFMKQPSDLKFVMIDPKKTELQQYNSIADKYLAKLPDSKNAVITDMEGTIRALESLDKEMNNRYDLLKATECHNITEYNNNIKNGKLDSSDYKPYPDIVLVIDEFADLLDDEVKSKISRLASLGRAVGIHTIITTNSLKETTITSSIKTNFQTKICLRCISKENSEIVLGKSGANQLACPGDMLIYTGDDSLTRVQGAIISEDELKRVIAHINEQKGDYQPYQLPVLDVKEGEGSDEYRKKAAKGYETQIEKIISGKSKPEIRENNYKEFTIKDEDFVNFYRLLFKDNLFEYSTKYKGIDKNFKNELSNICKKDLENNNKLSEEGIEKILLLCLQYPNDQAAQDILLMAEKKEGEHTQDEVDGLKPQTEGKLDELFEEAARLFISLKEASTSMIQRKFNIGYNRAGIIMDQLEAAGIVGPFVSGKTREVKIKNEADLENLLEKIKERSSKNQQETTREKTVKYYLPKFKIRRIICTYVLSNSYPNDRNDDSIDKEEKGYLEKAIKFLDGEKLDRDYTNLANLYKHLLLTKENITSEEPLQDLSIGDLVILAENKKLNGLIDKLTDEKTQEINEENCGDFTIGRDEFKAIYTMYFAGQEYGNGESRYGEAAYGIYNSQFDRIPSLMRNLYYAKIDEKTDEFEQTAYNLLSALLKYDKDSQLAKDILLIAKRKGGGDNNSNITESRNSENDEEKPTDQKKYKINPDKSFNVETASSELVGLYKNKPGDIQNNLKEGLENTIKYLNGEILSRDYCLNLGVSDELLNKSTEDTIKSIADDYAEQHKPFLIEIKEENEDIQETQPEAQIETTERWSITPHTFTREEANSNVFGNYTEWADGQIINELEQKYLEATVMYLNKKITEDDYLKKLGYTESWRKDGNPEKRKKEANIVAEKYKKYLNENGQGGTDFKDTVDKTIIDSPEILYSSSIIQSGYEGEEENIMTIIRNKDYENDSVFILTQVGKNPYTYNIDIDPRANNRILSNPSFLDGTNRQVLNEEGKIGVRLGLAVKDDSTGKIKVIKKPSIIVW